MIPVMVELGKDKVTYSLPESVVYRQIGCPLVLDIGPENWVSTLSDVQLKRTYRSTYALLYAFKKDGLKSPLKWRHPFFDWMVDTTANFDWISELFCETYVEAKYRGIFNVGVNLYHQVRNGKLRDLGMSMRTTTPSCPPVIVPQHYNYTSVDFCAWRGVIQSYKSFYLWELHRPDEEWTNRDKPVWVKAFYKDVMDCGAV